MLPVDSENGPTQPVVATRLAMGTFVVLFAMNMLDYLDRNVLMAMKPQITKQIPMKAAEWGALASFFLVSYSLVSPVMGWLGDRYRRNRLLAFGVGLWSVATIGSGLAQSYGQLALARSLLGVGEATYGVIAPTILIDLFAREQRARLMSAFYLAMPIGSALGMGVGSYVATTYNWHVAFFLVGVPGFLAALIALVMPEPVRGASEGVDVKKLKAHERAGASREDYLDMAVNSSYTYSVFGMAAYTFAIGGMLVWVPNYLFETRGINQVRAATLLGLVTLIAAVVGMSVGGWVADKMAMKKPQALFLVPGVAMLASIPFVLVGLLSTSESVIFAAILVAETLMFINTGPCNAIIANVVQPNMRAAAYAIAIFAVHFLGDIWSPYLIGLAADSFGDANTMRTMIGQALASIGATPTQITGHSPQNIVAGLLCVVPALLLSSIVLLAGIRHLPREMALMRAKLKAAPSQTVADLAD